MATMTSNHNLWQAQGVSILPKDPKDLLPLVGQKSLYNKLTEFRAECLSGSANKISGFFVLDGQWGVGKSRVGHEICLEAIHEEAAWVVDGDANRILEPGLGDGILPLFVRYSQVTTGKFGEELSADNWIPATIVEALQRLAAEHKSKQELGKNQDRLMKWTEELLKPKGWDRIKASLVDALNHADVSIAAKNAIEVLKQIGIEHLMIVVDEIEDVSDVEQDGLQSDERKPIDQVLLTVIPRVIKSEEIRQVFPEVSFFLLCSRAVGDNLRQIHAIDRRTMRHEIQTNAFSDVQDFFSYLEKSGGDVAQELQKYPAGLKEAAFFAADRNFGWFNVIMSRIHGDAVSGRLSVSELMRKFADSDSNVFDKSRIGSFMVDVGEHKAFVEESMYGLLPQQIGSADLYVDKAEGLIAKRTPTQQPLFARLIEIKPPQDTRIMTHLVNCGFKNESGVTVYLPGQSRFNVQEVMDSLKSYSQLANCESGHLLICEKESEFTAQIEALSAHGDQAIRFAPYLHGLFTDPAYEIKQGDRRSEFLAPSFAFLKEFHKLNRRRNAEEGFLRDGSKNTQLIEAFETSRQDSQQRVKLILQGFANIWQLDQMPTEVVSECQQTEAISFSVPQSSTQSHPLNLGWDETCIFVYGSGADDAAIETDLGKIGKRGALPVVLVLEDAESTYVQELRERIARNVPRIAPFLVIHSVTRQVADYIARLGMLGDVYDKDDLRTSQFNGTIGDAKQHLERRLQDWARESVDQHGLIIRPLFYPARVSDDELGAFAKGYTAMLTGESYHDVLQRGNGIFESELEQDNFRKMAERQCDPNARFADNPRLNLIVEEGGDHRAQIPRCFLAVMERCTAVPLKRSELEKKFLYEKPDSVKVKDIMGQLANLMSLIGLIEQQPGDLFKQVSSHTLKSQVNEAENWLVGPFDAAATKIKRINQYEGERLVDSKAKKARQELKDAGRELENLDLSFVKDDWDALNKISADGMPGYEQHLKKSLKVISKVKRAVRSVFSSEESQVFQYSADYLDSFEKNQSSDSYPLWKRVEILKGFYASLETQRRELIRTIDDTLKDVDTQVPTLSEGPYSGQKAFPTLALSRPLQAFRQELDFGADKPNKTVTAGGSSYAIKTVGYKISDNKYQEAQERLSEIKAELTQPGKIVLGFRSLLEYWEDLRNTTNEIRARIKEVAGFFEDSPEEIKQQAGLGKIENEFAKLEQFICQGGIREGTEDREAASAPIFQLVDGLKKDLDQVRNVPGQIEEDLEGLEAQAVQTLEIKYQSEYATLMRAWTGVRLADKKEARSWPRDIASTFGETRQAFEKLVAEMRSEGVAYFGGTNGTTFDDYIGLCAMELNKERIDWESSEFEKHINNLKNLKLLELKLK